MAGGERVEPDLRRNLEKMMVSPKSEIRRPKRKFEGRNPKAEEEIRRPQVEMADTGVGRDLSFGFRVSDFFRNSEFGFRTSIGLRTLRFGFNSRLQ